MSQYADLIAGYRSEDGYPAEEWIERFDALDGLALTAKEAARFLVIDLPEIAETINCLTLVIEDGIDEFIGRPTKRIQYHTGGWSGAEDLINVMLKQLWIEHFNVRWERGGHYYFEVPTTVLEAK